MLERAATRELSAQPVGTAPHSPAPVPDASSAGPLLQASHAMAPDPDLCETFSKDGPEGVVMALTEDSLAAVRAALESVPRPAGVPEGHTYQVGSIEIPASFVHRTHHQVAAWFTDIEVPPQTAPISRRHWSSGDSEPFVEPQGVLKEDYTPTLYGGVRVGDFNSLEHAGNPAFPVVSLPRVPMPSVVMVDLPLASKGPALTAMEQRLLSRIADQLPPSFREFSRNPSFWAIRADQLAGPGLPKEQVQTSLSYLSQMGYLQRGGHDDPEAFYPVRWEEIAAARVQAPPPAPEMRPPFRQPDRWEDHEYRRTGELSGARPVWDLGGLTVAGPSLVPEVIKPNGVKEQKQADATLHTLFHRALLVANGNPLQGHYHGTDDKGRHRVT